MRAALEASAAMTVLLLGVAANSVPSFTPIPGDRTFAGALSSDGTTVVGGFLYVEGFQPYRWRAATGTEIFPGADSTLGSSSAVSDDGETAGGAYGSAFYDEVYPARCSSTSCLYVESPSDFADNYGSLSDLSSDATHAVGNAWYDLPGDPQQRGLATYWGPDGTAVPMTSFDSDEFGANNFYLSSANGISGDGSVSVGWALIPTGNPSAPLTEAFRWTLGGGLELLGDLPGGAFRSLANDISNDGHTVVGFATSALGTEAFVWTVLGGMIGLGDLAGGTFNSFAHAVSANGSVVVGQSNAAAGATAFIWDPVNGMRSVHDVLSDLGVNLTGWILTDTTGISADGRTIAGNGINPAGQPQAWIAVIPEPSTLLLLGFGLAGLARSRRW